MPSFSDRLRAGGEPTYQPGIPQPAQWGSYPDAGGSAPAAPAAPGAPTAGMSQDQVRQYVQNYYASKGVTPNPTSVDYWTQKYFSPEFNGDFQYWGDRLGQADEFTGAGQVQSQAAPGTGTRQDVTGAGRAIGSLGSLAGMGQSFTPEQIMAMDPGYQFRLGQGQQAIEHGAAAKGTLLTGGTQKALQRYAQDYASGEFGNIFNHNLALGQLGLGATSQQGALGAAYANTVGANLTGNANAQAAGSLAQGNIWGSLPTQLAGLYDFYRNQNKPPVTPDPYAGLPGGFGTAGMSF